MIGVAEAERIVLESVASLPAEDCPLAEAHGRVLREAVTADRDLPPFDRATLDGIAVAHAALAAGRREFRVEGMQAAGMVAKTLADPAGGAIEIATGAALPRGADTVVPYEEVTLAAGVATVAAEATISPGQGVHPRGSDAAAGAVLLAAGRRITAREIGIAASVGRTTLRTALLPRVAVVATGDELVDVASSVAPHQIRRSNDYALRAALVAAGCPRVDRFHLRDLPGEIEAELRRLLVSYDWIIICGGASKGRLDHVPRTLEALHVQPRIRGVAQRPGKPFWFGISPRGTPVFALPGNPVSALTCLHRYVLPALHRAAGLAPEPPRRVMLAAPVTFKPPLTLLLPVRLTAGEQGATLAWPAPVNSSGDFAGLAASDGFVELPAGAGEFPTGFLADFRPWT